MVHAGHWTWRFPEPALPGVPGVPLTNYAGWVVVALVMVAALDAVVPSGCAVRPDDGGAGLRADVSADLVPAALLAWTWLGSGLANLAFFDRPAVAAYGLVAMGVCTGPYLFRVVRVLRVVRVARGVRR
jgi:putative membrane protein